MSAALKAWAIKGPDGKEFHELLSSKSQDDAWLKFRNAVFPAYTVSQIKEQGYTCVEVEITERSGAGGGEAYLRECVEAALFEWGDRFNELPEWFHEIWNRRVGYGLDHAPAHPSAEAADAARYRWLREHSWVEQDSTPAIRFGAGCVQTKPEILDQAIDSARSGR